MSVAEVIEHDQSLYAAIEDALPALEVDVLGGVAREGGNQVNPVAGKKLTQILLSCVGRQECGILEI